MTLNHYLRILREQWLVILLLTVVGAGAAIGVTSLQTPLYAAETQMFVHVTTGDRDISELSEGGTFTQQRVKSYADLVTGQRVLEGVREELGLPPGEPPAHQIKVTNPIDTVLLDVEVVDADPERAARVANAIAGEFPTYVSQLEAAGRRAGSPVQVSVTRTAEAPTIPVTPHLRLNLAIGIVLGLAAGLTLAVLRESLRRTVISRAEVQEVTGAPVLGSVVHDPGGKRAPIIARDGFSPRAEAYRSIRTNIRFLSVDRQVRSFVVTSAVAGEGKTATAANLAIAMATGGQSVVLVEADLRRPGIADSLGLSGAAGLTNVLLGDARLEDVIQRLSDDLPLRILAGGPLPPNPSELVGSSAMTELVEQLTADGDVVIFDAPGLLPVTDAAVLARLTDGALLVARSGATRIEQVSAAVEALRNVGAPVLGVVLNQVPRRGRGSVPHVAYGYAPHPVHLRTPAAAGAGAARGRRGKGAIVLPETSMADLRDGAPSAPGRSLDRAAGLDRPAADRGTGGTRAPDGTGATARDRRPFGRR